MFAATLVLTFVVTYVTAEIPSYINVCGRRNPNLDECIVQNVNSLKGKICTGMPEIGVQPTEPLYIDKLNIVDAPNAKISLSDVYLSGLCDFKINAFHMNLEKQHFDVDIAFNRIQMNMTYNFNVNIIAPVALKGPIHITTDDVAAKASVDLKVATKDGKDYVYLSNMNLDLDIKSFDADFSSFNDAEFSQLREIGQNLLGRNQQEIIRVLKPTIEKNITKHILRFSNKIVKNFTYDELFPDRA